eukprot:Hpha_TRINITY_DN15393_c2_g2::TRINITY_DN15393_c2_g2_i2::g.87364::m.87364
MINRTRDVKSANTRSRKTRAEHKPRLQIPSEGHTVRPGGAVGLIGLEVPRRGAHQSREGRQRVARRVAGHHLVQRLESQPILPQLVQAVLRRVAPVVERRGLTGAVVVRLQHVETALVDRLLEGPHVNGHRLVEGESDDRTLSRLRTADDDVRRAQRLVRGQTLQRRRVVRVRLHRLASRERQELAVFVLPEQPSDDALVDGRVVPRVDGDRETIRTLSAAQQTHETSVRRRVVQHLPAASELNVQEDVTQVLGQLPVVRRRVRPHEDAEVQVAPVVDVAVSTLSHDACAEPSQLVHHVEEPDVTNVDARRLCDTRHFSSELRRHTLQTALAGHFEEETDDGVVDLRADVVHETIDQLGHPRSAGAHDLGPAVLRRLVKVDDDGVDVQVRRRGVRRNARGGRRFAGVLLGVRRRRGLPHAQLETQSLGAALLQRHIEGVARADQVLGGEHCPHVHVEREALERRPGRRKSETALAQNTVHHVHGLLSNS